MIGFYLIIHKFLHSRRLKRLVERRIASLEGGFAYSKTIRDIYKNDYGLSIGYGTYGCCWNKESFRWQNITIGNYCSFASNVDIFRANHPLEVFTTHPISYNPVMGGVKKYSLNKAQLVIGHDVWIGQNVIIVASCKRVGNGAVIGAGAIVTKDVPPYAVVAGNPAKVIKYRFDAETIDKIEKSKWWLYDKNELVRQWSLLINMTK